MISLERTVFITLQGNIKFLKKFYKDVRRRDDL